MSEDPFSTNLDWFKQNEKPEVVLLIADSQILVRLAVAWTNMAVARTSEGDGPQNESEAARWEWLWMNVDYSHEELAEKAGISEYGLDDKLKSLIGNRILYPDGTINSYVQRYLREKVLASFSTKAGKSGTRARR